MGSLAAAHPAIAIASTTIANRLTLRLGRCIIKGAGAIAPAYATSETRLETLIFPSPRGCDRLSVISVQRDLLDGWCASSYDAAGGNFNPVMPSRSANACASL